MAFGSYRVIVERPPGGPSTDNDRPVYRVGGWGGGGHGGKRAGVCGEAGCGLCAELLGGRGAWRDTLFIVHPHWWAAGSRAGRRNFAPWDVPHTGELFQRAYICHGYYPRAFLVRTQLHRPSGILCSAAGWLAFGIPSACALTCVRLVPECVWSPNLAPRARLLALYPGCGLREPSGGCGPAGSGRAGIFGA